MSTSPMHLNERHLREALRTRGGDVLRDAELVDDVLSIVRTTPQSRNWPVTLRPSPGRRVPFVLGVAALLVLAASAGALIGGQLLVERPLGPVRPIVYVSGDWIFEGRPAIQGGAVYGIAPDGSGRIRLVDIPGNAQPFEPWPGTGLTDVRLGPALRWSPDGSRIAFRLFGDDAGIYVMNADGSDLRLLAESDAGWPGDPDTASNFAWAPDGSAIAFTSPDIRVGPMPSYDNGRLYVVDVASGRVTDQFGGRAVDASNTIAFSPDGAEIAFAREYPGNRSGLVIVRLDGIERRLELTEAGDNTHVGGIAWSPDGTRVFFEQLRIRDERYGDDSSWYRFVINRDGGDLRELSSGSSGCCYHSPFGGVARWSPDGTLIAVAEGNGSISVIAANGSGERLTFPGLYVDWSPDGSQLVASAAGNLIPGGDETSRSTSIFVIDADGSNRRVRAEGDYPSWRRTP